MYASQKIILASQSPRRSQILQWANVTFEIRISSSDEAYPVDLPPEKIAIHIARNKALAVLANVKDDRSKPEEKADELYHDFHHDVPILAADTVVVLNDEILGKPVDRDDAIRILKKLSGKKHVVVTGVVLLFKDAEISFADSTEVEFHALTKQQIEFYVDTYKPFDKAGAYAIQEWIGVTGVKSINGDFYNVMGLPISRVLMELNKLRE